MKKFTSLGLAAFAAVVSLLAIWGGLSPAQAYPEVQIRLDVDRTVLYGGQDFTATAASNVNCSWSLEWAGMVRQGASSDGTDFKTNYTAAKVSKITKIPLHGTCAYTSPSARGTASWERTIIITVLPQSSAVAGPVGSDMPNTGGPNKLFIAGGLGLLVAGATAVTIARRRAEEAEIQASRA